MRDVVLGVIAGATVATEFASCLYQTDLDLILVQGGPFLSCNRNEVVEAFLKTKAESYLLFVDSDIVWEDYDITRLLKWGKPAMAGAYAVENQGISCGEWGPEGRFRAIPEMPRESRTVGYAATGFLMVHRDVYTAIDGRWFDYAYGPHGVLEGEDISFCRRVGEAGFDIWLDPTVRLGHVKAQVTRPKTAAEMVFI